MNDDYQNNLQQPDRETKEWFDAINESAADMVAKSQKRLLPKILFVVIGLILAVGLAFLALFVWCTPGCLTAADYEMLTGSKPDTAVDLVGGFYSESIDFETNSSDYTIDKMDAAITGLGKFAKNKGNNSVFFSLSTEYYSDDDNLLANERLTAVRRSLVAAGVKGSAIVIEKPELVEPEDEESTEVPGSVAISLSSAKGCRP